MSCQFRVLIKNNIAWLFIYVIKDNMGGAMPIIDDGMTIINILYIVI